MTTIFLHGYLRDLHPEPIRVEANSAAEAISFLQLIPALAGDGSQRHSVTVPGFESHAALYERREIKELHLHPVEQAPVNTMAGAGGTRPGVIQIVIGVILVAAAYMMTGPIGGVSAGQVFFGGAMMILGGVLQLLAPQPKLDDQERSRYLGNGKNTVAIGTRIPLLYGRVKAYGHFISFDTDSGEFNSAPEPWYSSTFTDYGDATYSAVPPALPVTDPQAQDQSPTSLFRGVAYPNSMVEVGTTYITFDPVVLLAGEYDIIFQTGQTLRVMNANAGTTSQVTLLGGEINNMPPVGTSIAFTRNYG